MNEFFTNFIILLDLQKSFLITESREKQNFGGREKKTEEKNLVTWLYLNHYIEEFCTCERNLGNFERVRTFLTSYFKIMGFWMIDSSHINKTWFTLGLNCLRRIDQVKPNSVNGCIAVLVKRWEHFYRLIKVERLICRT